MEKRNHQRMRRLVPLVLCLCLLMPLLSVCASAQTRKTQTECVQLDSKTVTFMKGREVEKNNDYSITVKDITVAHQKYIFLYLTLENHSDRTLRFESACGQVAGYHVSTYVHQTVRPGKSADISLYFDPLALEAAGISKISNYKLCYQVSDEETWEKLYTDRWLTIDLDAQIDMDFYPCKKVIYEEDAFSLTLLGSATGENRDGPTMVFLLENNLDGPMELMNEGNLLLNDKEGSLYVHETVCAESEMLIAVKALTPFGEKVTGGGVGFYEFGLKICTGNWNPLVYAQLDMGITKKGRIQQCSIAAAKSKGYDSGMREYGNYQSAGKTEETEAVNLFMGMFRDYEPDADYISSLRRKYPRDLKRYSECAFTPYVNELLTLYLADLADNGFDYDVIEREDLCSGNAYVVELTENGESMIQVSFTINEYDPKAATIVTLGTPTDNYADLDQLNRNLEALWLMYETLNVNMADREDVDVIANAESAYSEEYGVMLRGQYDGLGYVQTTNSAYTYLLITPDLTHSVFEGMAAESEQALKAGDSLFFGSFEQDNDVSNGREKIEWRVLTVEGDRALVVSRYALDSRRFHETSGEIQWEDCSLRTWLNGDFYRTAFDSDERSRILSLEVEEDAGADKVFLLSRREAETYLPGSSARQCKATAYAVARGAYVNPTTKYSWWLLRTDGTQSKKVMSVNADGTMDYKGGRVESDKGTVRPAMWIRAAD